MKKVITGLTLIFVSFICIETNIEAIELAKVKSLINSTINDEIMELTCHGTYEAYSLPFDYICSGRYSSEEGELLTLVAIQSDYGKDPKIVLQSPEGEIKLEYPVANYVQFGKLIPKLFWIKKGEYAMGLQDDSQVQLYRLHNGEIKEWINILPGTGYRYLDDITLNKLHKRVFALYKQKKKRQAANLVLATISTTFWEITKENVNAYNDLAFFLEQGDRLEPSILLLRSILNDFSNRMVAKLNLADAYYKQNRLKFAASYYSSYSKQMKEMKKSERIPKRVFERISEFELQTKDMVVLSKKLTARLQKQNENIYLNQIGLFFNTEKPESEEDYEQEINFSLTDVWIYSSNNSIVFSCKQRPDHEGCIDNKDTMARIGDRAYYQYELKLKNSKDIETVLEDTLKLQALCKTRHEMLN